MPGNGILRVSLTPSFPDRSRPLRFALSAQGLAVKKIDVMILWVDLQRLLICLEGFLGVACGVKNPREKPKSEGVLWIQLDRLPNRLRRFIKLALPPKDVAHPPVGSWVTWLQRDDRAERRD